jgi:serine protease Do
VNSLQEDSRDCRGAGGNKGLRPIWMKNIAAVRCPFMIAWAAIGILLTVTMTVESVLAQASTPSRALSSAAETVLPAVIAVTIPNQATSGDSDVREEDLEESPLEDVLQNFFGELLREPPRRTVAAGIIIDATGLALTTAHGLREVTDVEAATVGGVIHKATIVGRDEKTDLAVLRLEGAGPFPFVPLGDSDGVRVGDWVIAISIPYGLGATVTAGIVSATPRHRARAAVEELFQTDAATYVDSAGSPLVNASGEVIGLSTVITRVDFGISFAIPSNVAKAISLQLVRTGRVPRAHLGVRVQPLTPGLTAAFGVGQRRGLLVADVSAGGTGQDGQLRLGDVLLAFNGQELETPYDLERALRSSLPGQMAALAVWRDRHERTIRVTLATERQEPLWTRTISTLPFAVRPITPELGVAVARVDPGPVSEAGLRAGDVIREINHHPIRTIADISQVVNTVRAGDWLAILVQRGRTALYVAVTAAR